MHGAEWVLLLHENTRCNHTPDTFSYSISSQTYASMSLVTEAASTEILCSRSEMSVASGNTNIMPFTQLHKEVTQCYIWLPGGQEHPTTPILQNNVPFTTVVVCHSDILRATDESEVMLHFPG